MRLVPAKCIILLSLLILAVSLSAEEKELIVPKGGNLSTLLKEEKIPGQQVFEATNALSAHYNLRHIYPNQKIYIKVEDEGERRLKELRLSADFDEDIVVRYNGYAYEAYSEKLSLKMEPVAAEGTIESSFYNDMAAAGVAGSKIMELFRIFSFDIDFQRDIRKGDTFKVLYYDFVKSDGTVAKHGPIAFAALKTNFTDVNLYGFVTDSNEYDYYSAEGKSVRKTLLKTPVANARISSTYGMRKNPIYGYEAFHKGLDFAAPKNTPILASGSGTVELAGWFDIYGNCIMLRHSNGYKTLYGHLNAYGKGIRKGVRVKQGQVIGYVGSTGMSTGPHLHYEVIFNGVKINPASVKSPPERNLTEPEMERFKKRKVQVDELFNSLKKTD